MPYASMNTTMFPPGVSGGATGGYAPAVLPPGMSGGSRPVVMPRPQQPAQQRPSGGGGGGGNRQRPRRTPAQQAAEDALMRAASGKGSIGPGQSSLLQFQQDLPSLFDTSGLQAAANQYRDSALNRYEMGVDAMARGANNRAALSGGRVGSSFAKGGLMLGALAQGDAMNYDYAKLAASMAGQRAQLQGQSANNLAGYDLSRLGLGVNAANSLMDDANTDAARRNAWLLGNRSLDLQEQDLATQNALNYYRLTQNNSYGGGTPSLQPNFQPLGGGTPTMTPGYITNSGPLRAGSGAFGLSPLTSTDMRDPRVAITYDSVDFSNNPANPAHSASFGVSPQLRAAQQAAAYRQFYPNGRDS